MFSVPYLSENHAIKNGFVSLRLRCKPEVDRMLKENTVRLPYMVPVLPKLFFSVLHTAKVVVVFKEYSLIRSSTSVFVATSPESVLLLSTKKFDHDAGADVLAADAILRLAPKLLVILSCAIYFILVLTGPNLTELHHLMKWIFLSLVWLS